MKRALLPLLFLTAVFTLAPNGCGGPGTPTPDANDDGIVNVLDASLVAGCNPTADAAASPSCAAADVDHDGDVDDADLDAVIASFGIRVRIEGTLVLGGVPERPPFAEIGSDEIGSFAWHAAAPNVDLRADPGSVSWTTPGGTLTAQLEGTHEMLPRDLESGRPLAPGAAGGCATGTEEACWELGDAEAASSGAFEALCAATRRDLAAIAPGSCLLDLQTSQIQLNPAIPAPFATIVSAMLAGTGSNVTPLNGQFLHASFGELGQQTFEILESLPFATRNNLFIFNPTVPFALYFRDGTAAPAPSTLRSVNPEMNSTQLSDHGLGPALTVEQQSVIGCGAHWSTDCDVEGPDWFRAEASLVLRFLHDDAVCGRVAPDGSGTRLPGCRLADDPNADPAIDGSTELVEPFTGEPYATELEAVAWNLAQIAPAISAGFDPLDPLSDAHCSLARPDLCPYAEEILAASVRELDDDPSGAPRRRWLWESGAHFIVTEASGDLAPYLGWALFAFGPEDSRVADGDVGVPFLLVPPGEVDAALDAPAIVRSPGLPQTPPAPDVVQGVAYGRVGGPSASE